MPPRKKPVEATPDQLDDLLSFEKVAEETTKEETVEDKTPDSEEISVEAARVAELEKKISDAENLSKTNPVTDSGQPVPEAELTPDQKKIRELEDKLAKIGARNFEERGIAAEDSAEGILIHILEDGFSAQGITFYRGQEIKFGPRAQVQTRDSNGESWLDRSEDSQIEKYGRVMFRKGPWPGKTYEGEAEGKSNKLTAPVINL